ncbi:hypothetical protein Mapa_008258 [Marchantia paleacea]|nr:hypothetical protein Mapa_008258 [Marchantia paleacea]
MAELKYSVWALAPADHPGVEKVAQHLQQDYGGPKFEAHVTVLGGITLPREQAIAKLQSLCRSLPPISYRLTGVDHGRIYYQCVYLTVDPTPQVMEANAKARSTFGQTLTQEYMPHLSLIYGDLSDEDKQSARAVAEEKYGQLFTNSEFVVSKFSLYETDPDDKLLKTWKLIAEFPLEGQN